ncbi:MAG: hypothetical protein JO341_00030 [Gammaproteobacteria bacterium]|nr:hypothetical protein [Gammaproteobacteria bacterium]
MRWDDLRESSNVEDVRGSTGGRGVKIGVGGTLLALVASYFFGIDRPYSARPAAPRRGWLLTCFRGRMRYT